MTEIITRFPPEPNDYLHLGHLKAMMVSFTLHENAKCILRMDDTNPDTETQAYVDNIVSDITWLGFTPLKLTYTSEYFDILHNFAIDLIKANLAYVDFSTSDEISESRRTGTPTKYRDNTIEINSLEFDKMKNRNTKKMRQF